MKLTSYMNDNPWVAKFYSQLRNILSLFEIHHDLDDPVHKLTPNLSKIYVSIIFQSVMMQELSYL